MWIESGLTTPVYKWISLFTHRLVSNPFKRPSVNGAYVLNQVITTDHISISGSHHIHHTLMETHTILV